MADDFGAWLAAQKCAECGAHAGNRQAGKLLCNAHLDNSPKAPPVFATND